MARRAPGSLTLTEFSNLIHVDLATLRQAIANGRLTKACLARDHRTGHVYIVNVALAQEEWEANRQIYQPNGVERGITDLPEREVVQRPTLKIHAPGKLAVNGSQPSSAFARARLRQMEADAILKELEVDRKAGKLVDKAVVEREYNARMAKLRTNILSAPTRLRQRCPDVDKDVFNQIGAILREILTDDSRASTEPEPETGG